jgi:plasmid stability protein
MWGIFTMASLTIRNLEDDLKLRLRIRAAQHGRSMEEEVQDILRQVVGKGLPPTEPRCVDSGASGRCRPD